MPQVPRGASGPLDESSSQALHGQCCSCSEFSSLRWGLREGFRNLYSGNEIVVCVWKVTNFASDEPVSLTMVGAFYKGDMLIDVKFSDAENITGEKTSARRKKS